jgi:hypothetical protein
MENRVLGRTGLKVSGIGFGTIPGGGFFGAVDDAESIRALHTAVENGTKPLLSPSGCFSLPILSKPFSPIHVAFPSMPSPI